jgi:hypothetical protein
MPTIWLSDAKQPGVSTGVKDGGSIIDSEGRLSYEPLGVYIFAWRPRRCRNGKTRWLCWVERHSDGTFTLGNRAF